MDRTVVYETTDGGSNPSDETMVDRLIRNDSTPEGKAIWDAVDRAAARAPEWVKKYFGESANGRLAGSEPVNVGSNPASPVLNIGV